MKYLKLFEQYKEISVSDVAWLYFLYYTYGGTLSKKDWSPDRRMPGTTCDESLSKFECVEQDDNSYKSTEACLVIINEYFGAKNFEEAKKKQATFEEYKKVDVMGYPIDKIPYELFMKKNPNISKDFD